jgi:hypothetical protein
VSDEKRRAQLANERGRAWQEEAALAILDATGLEGSAVPDFFLDLHDRLRHVYRARHLRPRGLWGEFRAARAEYLRETAANGRRGPQKAVVLLLRVKGAPGRRVARYAIMDLAEWDRLAAKLQGTGLSVAQRTLEGRAPAVARELGELQGECVGNVLAVVRAIPPAPRPRVAVMSFDDYLDLLSHLVEEAIW